MNYIVIGEPCVDLIHTSGGEIIHSYGGILYSVISLAVISGKNDYVYPVMNLGEDEYDNILTILGKHERIKFDGIYKSSHPTRKVNLYYNTYQSGKDARMEQSSEPAYLLEYEKIEKFLDNADAALVNMISGVDITLETFKKIRENFKGFIHIDIHNLVMKTNPDGSREHTHLDRWIEWCTNSDTVQMNEFEVAVISDKHDKEYQVIEEILINSGRKTEGVVITRGKNGVSGFMRKEKKFGDERFFDLDRFDVNAIENPKFVDSTGCGDVFAASFMYDFSKNRDFKKSLHYATRIASFKTSLAGVTQLDKLK